MAQKEIVNKKEVFSTHDKTILKQIFSNGLPFNDDDIKLEEKATEAESAQVQEAKKLEIHGVQAAEAGNVETAIGFFTQAVNTAPEWPSPYNNRAQALRLKGDITGAKQDLETAILLSHGTGNVACQAFTQRALLRKREGDDDGAKQDLEQAAKLGSEYAKQLLAAMNPYAALCNQMLCDVMRKLKSGQTDAEV